MMLLDHFYEHNAIQNGTFVPKAAKMVALLTTEVTRMRRLIIPKGKDVI